MNSNKNGLRRGTSNLTKSRKVSSLAWLEGVFYLIITGVIIYVIFFAPVFAINSVKVSGATSVQKNPKFVKITQRILGQNIFLMSSKQQRIDILKSYPELESLYIQKILPSILEINLEVRKLGFVWRWSDEDYQVSDKGLVYAQSTKNTQSWYVEVIKENGDIEIPTINTSSIHRQNIDFITRITRDLEKKFGYVVTKVVLADDVFQVNVHTDKYIILLSSLRDYSETISMLKNINSESFDGSIKQYVDLRVPGKIFYK
jgi:hypothetical protein